MRGAFHEDSKPIYRFARVCCYYRQFGGGSFENSFANQIIGYRPAMYGSRASAGRDWTDSCSCSVSVRDR